MNQVLSKVNSNPEEVNDFEVFHAIAPYHGGFTLRVNQLKAYRPFFGSQPWIVLFNDLLGHPTIISAHLAKVPFRRTVVAPKQRYAASRRRKPESR